MFTYKYQCQECKKSFEIKATLQQKEEKRKDLFNCPFCYSTNIKEKFSIIDFFKNIGSKDDTCSCNKGSCDSSKGCCN